MDVCGYVATRMTQAVCGIGVILIANPAHERVYEKLCGWTELCTERYGAVLFPDLPYIKNSRDELADDILLVYCGFLHAFPYPNSRATVHCLFTLTFYMMLQYKNHPALCSFISQNFIVISHGLRGWLDL
jgi:hypothetical protein